MEIINEYSGGELLNEVSFLRVSRTGESAGDSVPVLRERSLSITVNGEPLLQAVCLPQDLPELAAGRLLTEGLIGSGEEIVRIHVPEDGTAVEVTLRGRWRTPPALPVPGPLFWKSEWLFSLYDRFSAGMPLHLKSRGTHCACLGMDGDCLFCCEDIGRHNALDKAIGHAVVRGIDLGKCYLFSSGRMPTDMVTKVIRAGVPVFFGKGSPTGEAVELARRQGLTLVGSGGRDSLKLFSGVLPE